MVFWETTFFERTNKVLILIIDAGLLLFASCVDLNYFSSSFADFQFAGLLITVNFENNTWLRLHYSSLVTWVTSWQRDVVLMLIILSVGVNSVQRYALRKSDKGYTEERRICSWSKNLLFGERSTVRRVKRNKSKNAHLLGVKSKFLKKGGTLEERKNALEVHLSAPKARKRSHCSFFVSENKVHCSTKSPRTSETVGTCTTISKLVRCLSWGNLADKIKVF